jgi:ribonuclease HII
MDSVHVIATDEAGYGPNLGPLVVGATCWESPEFDFDFQAALKDVSFATKSELRQHERKHDKPFLMVADSKAVYSAGSIELLERGVLSFLCAAYGRVPTSAIEFASMVGIDETDFQQATCFENLDFPFPLAADVDDAVELGSQIRHLLSEHGVACRQVGVAAVFPEQFNCGIETFQNKASLLTATSLDLISAAMDREAAGRPRFDIHCDKHGGRNHYADAIGSHFRASDVETIEESRPVSRYRFNDSRSNICFCAKGESFLPVALASMVAKYTRELFMRQWNSFWQQHLPELKPTKGYPQDAKRFKAEIAEVQRRLEIADRQIWRMR